MSVLAAGPRMKYRTSPELTGTEFRSKFPAPPIGLTPAARLSDPLSTYHVVPLPPFGSSEVNEPATSIVPDTGDVQATMEYAPPPGCISIVWAGNVTDPKHVS